MAQQEMMKRVAVVTGASSGIGAATAQVLAQAGAAVVLLARRAERINQLASDIIAAGGRALALEADISDLGMVQTLAPRIREEVGCVNLLVNCAGVMLPEPFMQQDPQDWRTMMETNLYGTFSVTYAFLPQLLERGGDIISLASVAGRRARENFAVYNATKFGIVGWSDALRMELATKGVRVTVLEPGFVVTELQEHITDPTIRQGIMAAKDGLDPLHPEDIAQVILYAASLPANVCMNEILVRPTKEK